MKKRYTVEAYAFPVARPDARAAGVAGAVDFVVEVWVIDYDFVGVDSDDWSYGED